MDVFIKKLVNAIASLFAVLLIIGVVMLPKKITPTADQADLAESAAKEIASIAINIISSGLDEIRQISTNIARSLTSNNNLHGNEAIESLIANNADFLALPLLYPVRGKTKISSGFGYRNDPFTGRRAFHKGIDFPLKPGSKIYATGEGIVVDTGYNRFLGNYVKIRHEHGYKSIYGHLSRIAVKKNQKVNAGDLIAYSGNTGRSTGPHLHYQVNHNGLPVDPLSLINSMSLSLNE